MHASKLHEVHNACKPESIGSERDLACQKQCGPSISMFLHIELIAEPGSDHETLLEMVYILSASGKAVSVEGLCIEAPIVKRPLIGVEVGIAVAGCKVIDHQKGSSVSPELCDELSGKPRTGEQMTVEGSACTVL